ncbi:MAG: hypothetical protein WCK39_08150 [Methanomassiliicoccales archaeon]
MDLQATASLPSLIGIQPLASDHNPAKPYRNIQERRAVAEVIKTAAYRCGGTKHEVTADEVFEEIAAKMRLDMGITIKSVRSHLAFSHWALEHSYAKPAEGSNHGRRTYKMKP